MLDHFSVAPGAGFPDHPHRGQETITYLLSGSVDHEDFAGNKGTIETGDLQFMTAGRGIVHAEMPHQNVDGSSNIGECIRKAAAEDAVTRRRHATNDTRYATLGRPP